MSDPRDIVERLRYPARHANKARVMEEAAALIEELQCHLDAYGDTPPPRANVVTLATPYKGPTKI